MRFENYSLKSFDKKNPYQNYHWGFFTHEIELLSSARRRMVTYVPRDVQPSSAGVFLLPPSGVTIEEFLEKSNWLGLSDGEPTMEKLVLFCLESDAQGWHLDEPYGADSGDVAYLMQAFDIATKRVICCVHEAKYYMAGYRDGGTAAAMAAMFDPAHYSGLVTVDAPDVAEAYMAKAASAYADDLMGYVDETHSRGLLKRDIPLPVWKIAEDFTDGSAEARYWRNACGCAEGFAMRDHDTRVYVRTADTDYPLDQHKEAYRVWFSRRNEASKDFGRRINQSLWKDFLYGVRRWMADPGGSLRMTKNPVRDLGMEYHYEEVDGFMREWYVHVPESVKAHPDVKVPLVFASHGYSCCAEIYIGNSGWNEVADRYGFIVVFPTAIFGYIGRSAKEGGVSPDNTPLPTWNVYEHKEDRPDDLAFFKFMLKKTCAEHPVDVTRVFATGHSNGSMMTSWLGIAHPEWFAAVASCSGILHMAGAESCLEEEPAKTRARVDVPIWMLGGFCEPWLLDGRPMGDNRTAKSIRTWWELNEMPGEAPKDFGPGVLRCGRYRDWEYCKDGMPMIRFSGVEYFPHATMPEMSFRIWEEFFSKFARVDGKVVYTNP